MPTSPKNLSHLLCGLGSMPSRSAMRFGIANSVVFATAMYGLLHSTKRIEHEAREAQEAQGFAWRTLLQTRRAKGKRGAQKRAGLLCHPYILGGPERQAQGAKSKVDFDFAPRSKAVGTPPGGRGYVATLPTSGPPLILPPALKRSGPPRQQGLCSHLAHLWATSDSAPRFEGVGTPQAASVM